MVERPLHQGCAYVDGFSNDILWVGGSMASYSETQPVLPGLEGYVCTFECLTHCPLDDGSCYWDDPLIGMFDLIEYPEFFWWREDNKKLVRREPKDSTRTRCPRCLSVQVDLGYPYIKCKNCGYNEPLIDFPENVGCLMIALNCKGGKQCQ